MVQRTMVRLALPRRQGPRPKAPPYVEPPVHEDPGPGRRQRARADQGLPLIGAGREMSVTPRIELPVDVRLDGPRAGHRYFVLDVFTDRPLEGNQLGVFADARGLSARADAAASRAS